MTDALVGTEAPTAVAGYRPPPRYRRITAADGTMFDGSGVEGGAPLSVEIRSNLLGAEIEWLRAAREQGDAAIKARIAPLVRWWNCQRAVYDADADAVVWEALPPPAEAGPAVFDEVDLWTVSWIYVQLLNAPTTLGEASGRRSSPSGSPPAGPPSATPPGAPDAPSPTPSRRSRSKRSTSSATPAAST